MAKPQNQFFPKRTKAQEIADLRAELALLIKRKAAIEERICEVNDRLWRI